jgi:hypothetical protein
MADLQLSGNTVISESGGNVTWGTGAPSGSVLRVVHTFDNTPRTVTLYDLGNVYTNYGMDHAGQDLTSLDVTITPSLSTNKLYIQGKVSFGAATTMYGVLRMYRSIGGTFPTKSAANQPWHSTTNGQSGSKGFVGLEAITMNDAAVQWQTIPAHFAYLDSPNTTSEIVYRLNILAEADSTTTAYINRAYYAGNDYGAAGTTSYLTVMEIAG